MKRFLLLILLLFSCLMLGAEKYEVKIVNADSLSADSEKVILEGSVILEITTEGGSSGRQTRELKASKIVINTEDNEITASGEVSLKSDDLRDYTGDSLIFNWDSLDLLVYNGNSSIEKNNSESNKLVFYLEGENVSYSGDNGGPVFMENVVLATKEEEPYWSIEAENIALLESDFVFKNAVVKLGRVPVLWVPFLYYPNTRLAINPAVGISGSKGYFLNTTFELYGRYPGIWNSSTASSEAGAAFSALNLLSSDEKTVMVRDGIIYREEQSTDSTSEFSKWVKKTSSYLAFTADAYKDYGLALGIDGKNSLFDSSLVLNTKGVVAYKADPVASYYGALRYAVDFSASYKKNKTNLNINFPLLSDPEVRYDFYNRNTSFQLDTLLGSDAQVKTAYKSGASAYTWDASMSTSFDFLGQKFSLSTLRSSRTFKWNSTDHEFGKNSTVLPELNASLSGNLVKLNKEIIKEKESSYSNDEAQKNLELYRTLEENAEYENLYSSYAAEEPKASTEKDSYGLTVDYTAQSYLKDEYDSDDLRTFYLKANGDLILKAESPLDIINITETVSPSYVYKIDEENENPESEDFKVVSSLVVSSPVSGLKYTQTVNAYSFKLSDGVETEKILKWEKDYFTAHSIELTQSLGSSLSFTVKQQLKPMDLILTPSLTFKKGVYTVKASSQLYLEDDNLFKKGTASLNFTQKDTAYEFGISEKYDFSKEGWEGNTLTQNLSMNLFKTKLKFTEKAEFAGNFDFKTLNLGLSYDKDYIKLSFKGNDLQKDILEVHLENSLSPVYFWKNRIGLSSSVAAAYKKDFNNKYGSSLKFDLTLEFAVSEFLSLKIKSTSVNSSFYKYYDDSGVFSIRSMIKDLLASFDFFGDGRKSTGFNLSALSIRAEHYMHDWTLSFDAHASIESKNGEKYWAPEVTVMIKWNAIPELKKEWEQ